MTSSGNRCQGVAPPPRGTLKDVAAAEGAVRRHVGLVAMDLATGRAAKAKVQVTGPRVASRGGETLRVLRAAEAGRRAGA